MQSSTRPTRSTRFKTRPTEDLGSDFSDYSNHHLTPNKSNQEQLKSEETPPKKNITNDTHVGEFIEENKNDTPKDNSTDICDEKTATTPIKNEECTQLQDDEMCSTPTELKSKCVEEDEKMVKFEDQNAQVSTSESSVQNDDNQTEEGNKEETTIQNDKSTSTRQESILGSSQPIIKKGDLDSFLKSIYQKDILSEKDSEDKIQQKSKKHRTGQFNGNVHQNEASENTQTSELTDAYKPSSQTALTADQYFEAASYHVKMVTGAIDGLKPHTQSHKVDSTGENSSKTDTNNRSSTRRRKTRANANNLGLNQSDTKLNSLSANNSVQTTNQTTSRGKGRRRSPEKEPIARINVESALQATSYPIFFLETFSREHNILNGNTYETPKLVYSCDLLEKYKTKRLDQGDVTRCIKDDFDMNSYIKNCAEIWKVNWHPFSPEFAFKLLHKAQYDPEKALSMLSNPEFNFISVCDPPVRKYNNKWRPTDRRGFQPVSPYPPAKYTRGLYLQRVAATESGLH